LGVIFPALGVTKEWQMQGKILVVHRNELILDVIREMLQDLGYVVTQAKDGHRALGKALSAHYHLIIVNHALNGSLSGSQLVERMKKYGVQTPIIGTAPDADWATPLGFADGTVDYLLPSPFDYAELIKAVEALSQTRKTDAAKDMPIESFEDDPFASPTLPDLPALDAESDLLENLTDAMSALPPEESSFSPPMASESPIELPESLALHSKPQILLVETDATLTTNLKNHLQNEGFEVSVFHNGREAYEATLFNNFDFILTDLWLPGLDGFDMIDALRKSGVDAPIAILTGHITREMVQELIAFRICRILLKPTQPADIISLVHAKAC
jgi:DNA-binding response OmpR family regulator